MALRFTLRQLEYFVAVGDAGSIAAASERLNISSPSISTAITGLEAEFGVDLFVRQHAQGLSLTPGGRRFYTAAKTVLEHAGALHDVANDISEQVRGPLTVGCLVTVASFLLPELRRSFEAGNAEVTFRHEESNQEDLIRMLRRAEVDVAITYDLDLPQDIAFEPLLELPPYALVGRGHAFAKRKSVTLAELAAERLVLLDLPLSREYFLSLFQAAGLQPFIAERTPHLPMLLSLVASGFGYGLMNVPSKQTHAPDGKPLCRVPIEGRHRSLNLGLVTTRSERKPRILSAFEEHCRKRLTANLLLT
jgi:DNA-binding transcriptional LysR family regulator